MEVLLGLPLQEHQLGSVPVVSEGCEKRMVDVTLDIEAKISSKVVMANEIYRNGTTTDEIKAHDIDCESESVEEKSNEALSSEKWIHGPLLFCDEGDDEDEVFLGEMTEKEKLKAMKFKSRPTAVFQPGFRKDPRLMRYTLESSQLASVTEEGLDVSLNTFDKDKSAEIRLEDLTSFENNLENKDQKFVTGSDQNKNQTLKDNRCGVMPMKVVDQKLPSSGHTLEMTDSEIITPNRKHTAYLEKKTSILSEVSGDIKLNPLDDNHIDKSHKTVFTDSGDKSKDSGLNGACTETTAVQNAVIDDGEDTVVKIESSLESDSLNKSTESEGDSEICFISKINGGEENSRNKRFLDHKKDYSLNRSIESEGDSEICFSSKITGCEENSRNKRFLDHKKDNVLEIENSFEKDSLDTSSKSEFDSEINFISEINGISDCSIKSDIISLNCSSERLSDFESDISLGCVPLNQLPKTGDACSEMRQSNLRVLGGNNTNSSGIMNDKHVNREGGNDSLNSTDTEIEFSFQGNMGHVPGEKILNSTMNNSTGYHSDISFNSSVSELFSAELNGKKNIRNSPGVCLDSNTSFKVIASEDKRIADTKACVVRDITTNSLSHVPDELPHFSQAKANDLPALHIVTPVKLHDEATSAFAPYYQGNSHSICGVIKPQTKDLSLCKPTNDAASAMSEQGQASSTIVRSVSNEVNDSGASDQVVESRSSIDSGVATSVESLDHDIGCLKNDTCSVSDNTQNTPSTFSPAKVFLEPYFSPTVHYNKFTDSDSIVSNQSDTVVVFREFGFSPSPIIKNREKNKVNSLGNIGFQKEPTELISRDHRVCNSEGRIASAKCLVSTKEIDAANSLLALKDHSSVLEKFEETPPKLISPIDDEIVNKTELTPPIISGQVHENKIKQNPSNPSGVKLKHTTCTNGKKESDSSITQSPCRHSANTPQSVKKKSGSGKSLLRSGEASRSPRPPPVFKKGTPRYWTINKNKSTFSPVKPSPKMNLEKALESDNTPSKTLECPKLDKKKCFQRQGKRPTPQKATRNLKLLDSPKKSPRKARRGSPPPLSPRSPLTPCGTTNLPRVRFHSKDALNLGDKELNAVTMVHTLCNSHQVAKFITKPTVAAIMKQVPAARVATKLQWGDSLVKDAGMKHTPTKVKSCAKSILHVRSPRQLFPYSDRPPSPVVVRKLVKRTNTLA